MQAAGRRKELRTMNLESLIAPDFRGVISVTRGRDILLKQAYGYADLANRIPNTAETRFATASAGKVFVAVAILQLIERGQLSIGSTLGELLDMDLHQIDPQITVEQLLCHTSGIPDYFDESVMEDYEELWRDFPNYRIRKSADLLPLFIEKPMMYPRGTRFQYNNTGYVVLALILERVTGMPFDELLSAQVFEVYGMKHTGYYELDRLPAQCANNYIFDTAGRWRTNIYSVDAKGTGAGGAFTTADDIRLFWDSLLGPRMLSEQMTNAMLSRHSGDEEDSYGWGVWLRQTDIGFLPYFQGSDPGVSFLSEFDPRTGTVCTLVSNYGDNVWKIMRDIRAHLRETQ